MREPRASIRFVAVLLCPFAVAHSQSADSVQLGVLQSAAVRHDPRGRELDLLEAQSRVRQRGIALERRPTLTVEAQSQYQSDVARLPITLPGGVSVPTPAHDTYDARVVAQQKLYDPGTTLRRSVEDAQGAEAEARLRVALFPVRQHVSDLFFTALRAQSQVAELETSRLDLEAARSMAAIRVREGAALPSEENALRAALLRRLQDIAELTATRRTSLEVLHDLTGVSMDPASVLAVPEYDTVVSRARASLGNQRMRAEYEQFARTRELLKRQEDARGAQDKPRISAFGRAGYGRPGLNPLSNSFDGYWLAGVQFQWMPWTWGAASRDREVLALQRQILSAEEEWFSQTVRTVVAQDLAAIDRSAASLASDDEIISLRVAIVNETRARYAERVVTAAEYVDRQTDVLSARVARSLHRIELAQAQARFLNTLGIEVR